MNASLDKITRVIHSLSLELILTESKPEKLLE
jgi:hypothetical protein